MDKRKNDSKPVVNIGRKIQLNGFKIKIFNNGRYGVSYPASIFKRFPKKEKKFLLDNFIYARTRPLTLFGNQFLTYLTAKPALQKFIDYGIAKDLPCIGDLNNLAVKKLIGDFKSSQKQKIIFSQKKPINQLTNFGGRADRAVLAISFGKDSLLSYGLIKELGLNCLLAVGNEIENYAGNEWKIKKKIIRQFSSEQKQKVWRFYDNVDELFYNSAIEKKLEEADDTNSMLAYALEMLPFIYFYRAKYLILGNERNLNDYYFTKDHYRAYPSYDQSTVYTRKENECWKKISGGNFQVVSLIEPLYNVAEMKILYSRYPYLLKYLMSCAPDKGSNERWCYHCSMCAKAFLYSAAVGGDPKKIFFNENFFAKKNSEYYPLFAKKTMRHFEKPPQVRDEQLLSFLLASRHGWRGYLIDLFKAKYLPEAVRREKELRRKFFGVHPAINLPLKYKTKIFKIYQQELRGMSNP